MDQDGANNKFLTLGNELVLTPRFNPASQMVTYLSYFKNMPRVYLLDIETGTQEVVGDFPGMTFTTFSPDGKKIIIVFAKDGKSDIYTMDLENRIVEKKLLIIHQLTLLHLILLMENILHLILIEVVISKFM